MSFVFRITLVFSFFCSVIQVIGQNHTIYLIGDAGEDSFTGKALKTLQKHLEKDSSSSVIFLGDNAYPSGVNSKKIDQSTLQPYLLPEASKIYAQLQILRNYKGSIFFVNGNHDWRAQKKRKALESILNEEIIVEKYISDSTKCKNKDEINFVNDWAHEKLEKVALKPHVVDINDKITLLLFDSQFFFQKRRGLKVRDQKEMMRRFFKNCDSIIKIKSDEGRKILMASHHPIITNGNHAKKRQPLRFIFNYTPFWILGKIGIDRWLSQDIHQPLYNYYRHQFGTMLNNHPNLIISAGHDHNLQAMYDGDDLHLISGAGSKTKKLKRKPEFDALFSNDQKEGFMKLSFNEAGLEILEVISENNEVLYELHK